MIVLLALGFQLGDHLHPAIGAFFYVRIVSFRISTIIPIIDFWLLWLWRRLHHCLLLLLNIHRRRRSNHRRIRVIGIWPSETIASKTITPIITPARSISAEAKARIEAS